MHAGKTIVGLCRWFASEHGFSQLTPEARRAAWIRAVLAHVIILAVSLGMVAAAPKMPATLHNIVLVHFLVGLLTAKIIEIISAAREAFKRPSLGLVSSGWFFAFAVSLQPLLLFAFALWLLS